MEGIAYRVGKALESLIDYTTAFAWAPFAVLTGCTPHLGEPKKQERVAAVVNDSSYEEFQKAIFGKRLEWSNRENIKCGDEVLDGVDETDSVESCREIAGGDMEISPSELVYWAVTKDQGISSTYPAIASMKPSTAHVLFFDADLLTQVLEAHGVSMNAPVVNYYMGKYADGELYGDYYYDISEDEMAIVANNESFRLFWEPNGDRSLLIQPVFDVFLNDAVKSFKEDKE